MISDMSREINGESNGHNCSSHWDWIEIYSPIGKKTKYSNTNWCNWRGSDENSEEIVHEEKTDDDHTEKSSEWCGNGGRKNGIDLRMKEGWREEGRREYLIDELGIITEYINCKRGKSISSRSPFLQNSSLFIEFSQFIPMIRDCCEETLDSDEHPLITLWEEEAYFSFSSNLINAFKCWNSGHSRKGLIIFLE